MGRKSTINANKLTLEPCEGGYRLFGYINGEQVRRKGADLAKLDALKFELENKAAAGVALAQASMIDPQVIRDAGYARHLLGNAKLTLAEAVSIALAQVGTGEPKDAGDALVEYLDKLEADQCSPRHLANVRSRGWSFLRALKVKNLGEIDPARLAARIQRKGIAGNTAKNEATVIAAFLNFCVARKYLAKSPFELDMNSLRKVARRDQARPLILTPQQAQAMLDSAIRRSGGNHVPYVILGIWGALRPSEIERITSKEIRFEGKNAFVMIYPDQAKTVRYREVMIPENVTPLLKECLDAGIIDHEPYGPALRADWARIREDAGLVKAERVAPWWNLKTVFTGWQEDIMRHSGISYYFRKCGNVQEVCRWAGNSAEVAFQHYITLAKAEDTAAFYAVTGRLGAAPVQQVA